MIFAVFATLKPDHQQEAFLEKSKKWWDTDRPPTLTFRSAFSVIGAVPDLYILETDNQADLHSLVHYWPEFDFVIHPAYDLLDHYRRQGMKIPD